MRLFTTKFLYLRKEGEMPFRSLTLCIHFQRIYMFGIYKQLLLNAL